ncbi:hypothetical protein ACH5RR_033318 [Cinchona calisaya]|uniref:Uncharacterized protein n=1 Tax=Cinchona calisaya TaxID=153742 RepID=A0ABD2YKK6_9GENT
MAKGKEAKQIIVDDKFWNNCLILVRIIGPLIRLLGVCDANVKPSMGYIYEDDDNDDKFEEDVDLESFQRRGIGLIDHDDEWLN